MKALRNLLDNLGIGGLRLLLPGEIERLHLDVVPDGVVEGVPLRRPGREPPAPDLRGTT